MNLSLVSRHSTFFFHHWTHKHSQIDVHQNLFLKKHIALFKIEITQKQAIRCESCCDQKSHCSLQKDHVIIINFCHSILKTDM